MTIVEITEDKFEKVCSHAKKAAKHIDEFVECLEELKQESRMNHRRGRYGRRDEYEDDEMGERRGGYRGGRYDGY